MSRLPILIFALLLSMRHVHAMAKNNLRVCALDSEMPHESIPKPLEAPVTVQVPLKIRYLCSAKQRAVGVDKPLLVFMPNILHRPIDYARILTGLARRGFVVAYPDYKERNLRGISPAAVAFYEFIDSTRAMGFKCPRNGQIASTSLVTSVLKYMSTANLRSDIQRSFSTEKTVLFGHSLGGSAIETLINGDCDIQGPPPADLATDPQVLLRVLCEQYKPEEIPGVKIMGFVTFEGFAIPSAIEVPDGKFYVGIHSSFATDDVEAAFDGKSFGGKLATVLISNTNHFGPNNYIPDSDGQRPACAQARESPENMFATTRDEKNKVISTIARLTIAAYKAHTNGKSLNSLKRFIGKRDFSVEEVTVR